MSLEQLTKRAIIQEKISAFFIDIKIKRNSQVASFFFVGLSDKISNFLEEDFKEILSVKG